MILLVRFLFNNFHCSIGQRIYIKKRGGDCGGYGRMYFPPLITCWWRRKSKRIIGVQHKKTWIYIKNVDLHKKTWWRLWRLWEDVLSSIDNLLMEKEIQENNWGPTKPYYFSTGWKWWFFSLENLHFCHFIIFAWNHLSELILKKDFHFQVFMYAQVITRRKNLQENHAFVWFHLLSSHIHLSTRSASSQFVWLSRDLGVRQLLP